MSNPLLILAGEATAWRDRPLLPEVERHARRALLDWMGALLAGCQRAPATLIAKALNDTSTSNGAYCYVTGRKVALRQAALVNATASHTVEFDDIYRDAGYHPGAPTIAAALAAAQATGSCMDEFLRAIIAGYEVSCRIGLAVQPSHYKFWHTTGTVGTFGAASATALLLGASDSQQAHALALAATMASGLQQAFRGEGMSKPLHAGHAAEAGALAAMLAVEGVTGALDVLDGPSGFAAATSEDTGKWEAAFEGLGAQPVICNITFKNYGCCGHIFAALDGLGELCAQHAFKAADIERIDVGGYSATKQVCDRPLAATEQDCRFSTQYCLAALLVLGGVRLDAFEPEALNNSSIRELMPRIYVTLDPELTEAYPRRRAARVSVHLKDGRTLSIFQPTRKGDPDAPLSDDDLFDKFRELALPTVSLEVAENLRQKVMKGHQIPMKIPLLESS